jgi:hypothetical protein
MSYWAEHRLGLLLAAGLVIGQGALVLLRPEDRAEQVLLGLAIALAVGRLGLGWVLARQEAEAAAGPASRPSQP